MIAMKEKRITVPELILVAGTRAILGAGLGLLLSGRLSDDQRKAAGWALFLVGALTTIPLALEILGDRALESQRGHRDLSSVARWDGRVDVPSPASMLVFVAGLLVLAVRERPRGESPGADGDGRQRQQADMEQRSTNHLFLHARNLQRRAEADARRRLKGSGGEGG